MTNMTIKTNTFIMCYWKVLVYDNIYFSARNTVLVLFVSLYILYFHTSSSKQNRDMQLTMFKEKTRENAHLTNLRQSTYTITQTLHGKIARSLICNLRSKSFRHVVIRASVFHNSKGMKLSHTAILLRPSLWSFDKVWES